MNRPSLAKLTKEQLQYIEYLEAELSSYKNDGAKRLLSELSNIAGDFADDIVNLREGSGVVKYINDDKSDAILDKTIKLIDKMDKFKLLAQLNIGTEEQDKSKAKSKIVKRPEDLIRVV